MRDTPATQSSLLDLLPPPPQPEPKVDLVWVRRYLHSTLAQALAAEKELPWDRPVVNTKCHMMRQLSRYLPAEEVDPIRTAFFAEMIRRGHRFSVEEYGLKTPGFPPPVPTD